MDIPAKIRIGSASYKVKFTDEELTLNNAECNGVIDFNTHTIKITNKDLDKHGQEETFLHEVTHGILHEMNVELDEQVEERICTVMAKGLHQIIKDNKTAFKPINVSIDFPISVCKEVEDAIKGLHNKVHF